MVNKTDEQLKKEVTESLYWDNRIDASNIKVSVQDKHVTLSGNIPSFYTFYAAEEDVWLINGVEKLTNNLSVKYPSALSIPLDEDLKERISNIFAINADLSNSEIDVSVDRGIVTLEGSVDSLWKKDYAEHIAQQIIGALDIVNKITVVPVKDIVDKTIAEDVINAIQRNSVIDPSQINVKIENGIAILSGQVPDWVTYSAIYRSAYYTLGVVEVVDKLTIQEE